MLTFVAAMFALMITPGPGVLTIAGFGAGHGVRGGLGYMLGVVAGMLALQTFVASGLAAIVFAVPGVRPALLAGSTGYLCYLAARIAFAGSRIGFLASDTPPRFWNGVLLSVLNPKGYAVATTVFSGFPFWPDHEVAQNTAKLAVIALLALPVHFAWLHAGAGLRRLALSPAATRVINIAMAAALMAVVALAVSAELA